MRCVQQKIIYSMLMTYHHRVWPSKTGSYDALGLGIHSNPNKSNSECSAFEAYVKQLAQRMGYRYPSLHKPFKV